MTKLRLGLALSSIKRIFADSTTDDGFRILTQSLDSIISQRGEFFVTQEAPVSADFIETEDAFFETGETDSVSANSTNSHFLPKTVPYDVSLGPEVVSENNDRFVSVIGSTTSGTLYISERD